MEVHLKVGLPPSFSLEKAVCSYGFFMTAPNRWSPVQKTLERPLRLLKGQAVMLHLSQRHHHLRVRVLGVDALTPADQHHILAQVLRMLRLTNADESCIVAFQSLHPEAKLKGFGRLFRSPTLFEDIVKSILLCNSGWARTLGMAKSLCELQAELKGMPLGWSCDNVQSTKHSTSLLPETPECKDLKRKCYSRKTERKSKTYRSLDYMNSQLIASNLMKVKQIDEKKVLHDGLSSIIEEDCGDDKIFKSSGGVQPGLLQEQTSEVCSNGANAEQSDYETILPPCQGAFPIPEEISGLDVGYLTKRCGLGYRGKRIWKLAKDICTGVLNLESLEEQHISGHLQSEDLRSKLLELPGLGPFTSANVLMCMGVYKFLPADSETIRHLKQVHGRSQCTMATVSKEIADIYGFYGPFQFLAYWFELWASYENKFGQLSSMHSCDYKCITGHNMRLKPKKFSTHLDTTQLK